jgi:hypothetical protein
MKCGGIKEWNVIFVDSIYYAKLICAFTKGNLKILCLKP